MFFVVLMPIKLPIKLKRSLETLLEKNSIGGLGSSSKPKIWSKMIKLIALWDFHVQVKLTSLKLNFLQGNLFT